MNKLRSHFRFTKRERSGIFFLLLLIVLLQMASYLISRYNLVDYDDGLAIDDAVQVKIDSIKQNKSIEKRAPLFPFNPNYITDYKGYQLGMSPSEIDRLHAFRKQGRFVNSTADFQMVTQVSDSLLGTMAPYFKFPEWVGSKNKVAETNKSPKQSKEAMKDLNTASVEDLMAINGVGKVLSDRIIKFRNSLGGFLVDDQLNDVYGLEPEVVQRVQERFRVLSVPEIEKISINSATVAELSKLTYLQKKVAEAIVDYRNSNGNFKSFDELQFVDGFPLDRIERIKLYLHL